MTTEEQLDGVIDLDFRIVVRTDERLSAPPFSSLLEKSDAQRFLLIEEATLLLHLDEGFDVEKVEEAINAWISRPAIVTRGMVFSVREVVRKLKRLGFREKSSEGSHVHFVSDERKGKVTVPVHGGEIRKGTLKSILNQAGVDMNAFVTL